MIPVPDELLLHQRSKVLDVVYGDTRHALPAEYLRVFSPSAEVQGHGPGQGKTLWGKRGVGIDGIDPVGSYAVRLRFDDGHDSGLYSWSVLHNLTEQHAENWADYLARLDAAGLKRDPGARSLDSVVKQYTPTQGPKSVPKPAPQHARLMKQNDTTHFGYQDVRAADKAERVGEVFTSVAGKYDVMNDLMSMGVHRVWKHFTINLAAVRAGESVLDLASGTCDLAGKFARQVGPSGRVVASDINAEMLAQGRARMIDRGQLTGLEYALADAEALPFDNDSFDCVTMAFGLRNVTDKDAALAEIARVLRPGGRALILEFSKPVSSAFAKLYDEYSFRVLPKLGKLVAGDAQSYQYLAESIRMHPDQQTLQDMMQGAGLIRCQHYNLTGGVVALHRGYGQ